jgi:tetratricopeptide (TPR) repeat protein
VVKQLPVLAFLAVGCGGTESPPPTPPAPAQEKALREANPKDAVALFMRGGDWLDKGEWDNAIKDFDECIRLDPTNASAFVSRGIAWAQKKDYDKAIRDYDGAIRLGPKNALALYNRGIAWHDKKEYDKAIRDYDDAIRLDPRNAFYFIGRGLAWTHKLEYDKAIRDYDEAVRLNPNYALTFRNRGVAWRDKQEYDKAIRDLDEAIRLDPKNAFAFSSRGLAWWHKKEYEKAIRDLDEAIRLDPTKHAHPVVLGHFAARRAKDDAAAKRFLKDYAAKLDESAWPFPVIRFLRCEIDEPALLKLATDDEKRTEARCYLGLEHALGGRKDEALAHFRWVKEHGTRDFYAYQISVAELERVEK